MAIHPNLGEHLYGAARQMQACQFGRRYQKGAVGFHDRHQAEAMEDARQIYNSPLVIRTRMLDHFVQLSLIHGPEMGHFRSREYVDAVGIDSYRRPKVVREPLGTL